MEQIVKRDGVYYYGETRCDDADHAYRLFRADYHRSVGKVSWLRLDRIGRRTERIHDQHAYFIPGAVEDKRFSGCAARPVPIRLLGIIGISYCYILGMRDYPMGLDEESVARWLDWAFTEQGQKFSLVGRKEKAGRTSKQAKKQKKKITNHQL